MHISAKIVILKQQFIN